MEPEQKQQNEQIIKVTEVKGTPFSILEVDGEFTITIGRCKLSAPLKTEKEALDQIKKKDWELILSCMLMIKDFTNDKTTNPNE